MYFKETDWKCPFCGEQKIYISQHAIPIAGNNGERTFCCVDCMHKMKKIFVYRVLRRVRRDIIEMIPDELSDYFKVTISELYWFKRTLSNCFIVRVACLKKPYCHRNIQVNTWGEVDFKNIDRQIKSFDRRAKKFIEEKREEILVKESG